MEIVRISPETVEVRGGRVVPTTFSIEYRIAHPEKIKEAEIRVSSEGFGILQRQPIPVEASAVVQFALTTNDDFGPLVRFRLVCPSGTTEWRVLGGEPRPLEERMAKTGLNLTGVSPSVIRPSYTGVSDGSGTSIGLHGSGLTPDCTIEGEVDGRPIQLNNPYFRDRGFRGLLMHRDIDGRPVGNRYLQFGVSMHGPGIGQMAVKRVHFNE